MKRTITLCTAALLITAANVSLAASEHTAVPLHQSQTMQQPQVLFTVAATSGFIHALGHHHYQLHLQLPSTHQVLMFSDRPYRLKKYISGAALGKYWHLGANNFTANPPNAVLSASAFAPAVIVLGAYTYHHNEAIINFYSDETLPATMLHHPTLTIDTIATIESTTNGLQDEAAAEAQQTCTDATTYGNNGLLGAVGIGEAISYFACGDSWSGIDAAISAATPDVDTTQDGDVVATIGNTTDLDAGQIAASAAAVANSSTECQEAAGFAGSVQGGQNVIADIAAVATCGDITQLAVTTADDYDYLSGL